MSSPEATPGEPEHEREQEQASRQEQESTAGPARFSIMADAFVPSF